MMLNPFYLILEELEEEETEEEEIRWAMYEKEMIKMLHMERVNGLYRTDH